MAGLGYFWVKRELPFDKATISSRVMYVGSPCLIYSALTSNAAETAALGVMGASAFLVILMGLIFSWVFLKIAGGKLTTYLPAVIHPNCGNMGLPLVMLALGQEGLALGMAYSAVNSITQYTRGRAMPSGHPDIRELMKQPISWSGKSVLTVILGDFQRPQWFNSTTSMLAGITIPAMLIKLGTSLGKLNVASQKEKSTNPI
jgi:Predicted permeases